MASPYLKKTRSPEELDALIEGHLDQVSTNEQKFVEKNVFEMIGDIDRVCENAVSMIEERTGQVVAQISSWVETTNAEIYNDAEAAKLKITSIVEDPSDPRPSEIVTGMISEVTNLTIDRVSQCAVTSIRKIRSETSQSIEDLRKKVADSFSGFSELAAKAAVKIRESIVNAGRRFEAAKEASNGQEALEQVKKETEKAVADAERASGELEKAKARTINLINEALDVANELIEQAFLDAKNEIQIRKEQAVLKLDAASEAALALYSKVPPHTP